MNFDDPTSLRSLGLWINWILIVMLFLGGCFQILKLILETKEKRISSAWSAAREKDLRDKLETSQKQVDEVKNKVVLVDPENLPIKSIAANVNLLISGGDYTKSPFLTKAPLNPHIVEFVLRRERDANNLKSDPLAILNCVAIESETVLIPEGSEFKDVKTATPAHEFSMRLNWPSGDFIDTHFAAHPELRLWIDKNSASTKELDIEKPVAAIFLFGLPAGAKIIGGSCVVTLNSSIQRKFSLPKQTNEGWLICPSVTP